LPRPWTASPCAPPLQELPLPKAEPAPVQCKVVAIGADHGGYELKELLKRDLAALVLT